MKHNGQIAIEFLLLIAVAFFVVLSLLVITFSIYESNSRADAYGQINDFGTALQQEFLLASQMEDGYTRRINLPITMNGMDYNITIGIGGAGNSTNGYMLLNYEVVELYYLIPRVIGNISFGDNILRKENGTLLIN
ncbi:MAG: hypothetical protein ACP5NW_03690 [Candidatus Woesearchaeota archaeon]